MLDLKLFRQKILFSTEGHDHRTRCMLVHFQREFVIHKRNTTVLQKFKTTCLYFTLMPVVAVVVLPRANYLQSFLFKIKNFSTF